jgi:hypothetical protein
VLNERDLQVACVKWCQTKGIFIFAIPNGGYRTAREASSLKSQGVMAGVPDLFLPDLRLFVELKAPSGYGRVSADQEAVIERLRGSGYGVLVTNSFEEFKEVVLSGAQTVV